MELRATLEVNVVRNERTYRLLLPIGAPFEECYDILAKELRESVEFLEKQSKDQLAAAQQQADSRATPEEVNAIPVTIEATE